MIVIVVPRGPSAGLTKVIIGGNIAVFCTTTYFSATIRLYPGGKFTLLKEPVKPTSLKMMV